MRTIVVIMLLGAALLAGCTNSATSVSQKSEQDKFNVTMLINDELKEGRNDVALRVSDSSGKPVNGANIEVTPWMPEMGHGVMWIPKITEKENGLYNLMFILNMGGHWELQMKITQGDLTDNLVFDFPDVKGKKPNKKN